MWENLPYVLGPVIPLLLGIIAWMRLRKVDSATARKTDAEATRITSEDVRGWMASAMAAERKVLELERERDMYKAKLLRYESGNGK